MFASQHFLNMRGEIFPHISVPVSTIMDGLNGELALAQLSSPVYVA